VGQIIANNIMLTLAS